MIRPDEALSRLGGASPEGDALLILAYVSELEGQLARSDPRQGRLRLDDRGSGEFGDLGQL